MPEVEDPSAGSSDNTHDILVHDTSDTQKKAEQVTVVSTVDHTVSSEREKFTADVPKDYGSPPESGRGPSFSTGADQTSDTGSTRSMPVVRVSESPTPFVSEQLSPMPSPVPSPSPSTLSHRPPPSPARSHTLQEPSSQNVHQRRARHRSTMLEGRAANRLSGFFNNLMRRDTITHGSRESAQDSAQHSASTPQNHSAPGSEPTSRPGSPTPTRPVTPPPALPPPTLSELGLYLSTMTSDLSPSHFSSPPTSGAFLAPHYLLLCHAQGLDVLPLVSPPAPQPYALVRRVNFKSVVVMEQRGVLVAIAGRRDGVRVYALEEVKKAIEWRIDVEIRRERERLRRENLKKTATIRSIDGLDFRDLPEKPHKGSLSTPPPGEVTTRRTSILRKASHGSIPIPPSPPPVPLIPRSPIARLPKQKPRSNSVQSQATTVQHSINEPPDNPPPYVYADPSAGSQVNLRTQPSALSLRARSQGGSVNNVLSGPLRRRETSHPHDAETKVDWAESSDDEAIDIVAAGASGGQALDERTSATLFASRASTSLALPPVVAQSSPLGHVRSRSGNLRRNRPSNLDLSLALPASGTSPPEPSPAPTLLSLRQALSHSPQENNAPLPSGTLQEEDEDEGDGRISLAQALLESRLPELPPLGTTRIQEPILINPSTRGTSPVPGSPDGSLNSRQTNVESPPTPARRRRRRWSVLISSPTEDTSSAVDPPLTAPATERSPSRFSRSHSFRSNHSQPPSINSTLDIPASSTIPPSSPLSAHPHSAGSRTSRFIPRIISNAFNGRRSEERIALPSHASDSEASKAAILQSTPQAPPPKLEYVKLPGTKNALAIKAVETAKKSFLAILCGDNGEKVELFAGTYRTALGLSRTFILPDSPRSLELQLQGDDLVEVFLVFPQNVFGLEPATVRVREVRIGRAERRAARRRARGPRPGETASAGQDVDAPEEDSNVNVTVGVSISVGTTVVATGQGPSEPGHSPLVAREHPEAHMERPGTPVDNNPPTTSTASQEDNLAVVPAQLGPYTTFQQLNFAPKFPLASIADEYIIPPTYASFLQYRKEHESDTEQDDPEDNNSEPPPAEFSPPGLPVPAPTTPTQWYYRDPKEVVHGPWKSSLMQAWYKQGLLPPDLPVRREEDNDFTLLKELRLQSVDPTQPFRHPATPLPPPPPPVPPPPAEKPFLSPISLLAQPRHFGPPALFFSSRGGHSTTIVDSRGRSVLKGRFVWTNEDNTEDAKITPKMGDVKRLEAFDVQDRSVLVAMRQGGLEVVDLRDALLKPADESRTVLPDYNPPVTEVNRRPPFVWRIGTPITTSSTPVGALSQKPKSGFGNLASRRPSSASGKGVAGKSDVAGNESSDLDPSDEVFFVGRKEDEIYFCERNAGSFRILRLAPNNLNV
ncbi:hypothetical protein FA15DRAFT_662577 [Coprinopsis marcescibilis]|uniref:GYF domain-containing protein n=1 Tax=Coprinopsis marcescibilis TaxID=230819 RepID=A0A5C3LBZ4_COPMA|nr:hypothetical protein FA15DRAFT_662577 [Coprinopsis marcescibilis]